MVPRALRAQLGNSLAESGRGGFPLSGGRPWTGPAGDGRNLVQGLRAGWSLGSARVPAPFRVAAAKTASAGQRQLASPAGQAPTLQIGLRLIGDNPRHVGSPA